MVSSGAPPEHLFERSVHRLHIRLFQLLIFANACCIVAH